MPMATWAFALSTDHRHLSRPAPNRMGEVHFFLYLRSLNHLRICCRGDFPRNVLDVTTIPHLDSFLSHVTGHGSSLQNISRNCHHVSKGVSMSFWCSTGMLWTWKHGVKSQRCKSQFQSANKEDKQNQTRRINVWLMYNLTYFYQQIN